VLRGNFGADARFHEGNQAFTVETGKVLFSTALHMLDLCPPELATSAVNRTMKEVA
jgi:hypothetical protein